MIKSNKPRNYGERGRGKKSGILHLGNRDSQKGLERTAACANTPQFDVARQRASTSGPQPGPLRLKPTGSSHSRRR